MKLVIAVGTKNPAKINAVQQAFEKMFPTDFVIVNGLSVISSVASQPMDTATSITGARHRAKEALLKDNTAIYGVGLEGGLEQIGDVWFDCGWCVIIDRKNQEGIASSARISTPPVMMEKILQGVELGEVIDIVFNTKNAKQKEGHFGLMTNNAVTRTDGYVQGICMAFSRFLHPELFI